MIATSYFRFSNIVTNNDNSIQNVLKLQIKTFLAQIKGFQFLLPIIPKIVIKKKKKKIE
jgi:hypothetical protein